MVSGKAVPGDLNLKFRSKFNHDFTNHRCLDYAKTLYDFIGKRAHKVIGSNFFLPNVQNEIFEILMFKNSMKFTIAELTFTITQK